MYDRVITKLISDSSISIMNIFILLIILVNISSNLTKSSSIEINNKQIIYRIPSWSERYEKFLEKIQYELQGLNNNEIMENDDSFYINISLTLNLTISGAEEEQTKIQLSKQSKDLTIL